VICFGWFWQVAVWALDQSLFIKPIHICWSSAVKHKHLYDITIFYQLYFHLIIMIIIIIIKLYLQKHHVNYQLIICARVSVFYATFNNISAISWRSVLLVRKLEYPEKTINLPQMTDKLFSRNVVSSTPRLSGVRTHNVSHDMH
jgi:hypothetical protein